MPVRALALIALLLLPTAALLTSVDHDFVRCASIGTVIAVLMGASSRPVAAFAFMAPVLYAAAALTSGFTDGVAALIVAVAAAAGAASSQGYHRGLFGLLAAVLIGSVEPAAATTALPLAGAMLAGVAYGYLLVNTVARNVEASAVAVQPQTALSYAMLLAVLVLIAWLGGRITGIEHAWWLPLSVAVLGEPSLERSAGRAVTGLAAGLVATLGLVIVIDAFPHAGLRAVGAVLLLLAVLQQGRRHAWLLSFALVPLIALFTPHAAPEAGTDHWQSILLASALVFSFTVLGKWMLWTLRPDHGRAVDKEVSPHLSQAA